jgi:GxxExxY protein
VNGVLEGIDGTGENKVNGESSYCACCVLSVSFRWLFVEVKAAEDVYLVNKAQVLSYMKLLDIPLGLIINFNDPRPLIRLAREI